MSETEAASRAKTAPVETALVRRALSDRQAYGELVQRYRQQVVAVVYRMCGDVYLAEEAAQEAFIRAWQHLESYDMQRPFRNWLYRIAINAALDALRRQPPVSALEGQPLAAPAGDPENILEHRERAEAVRQAVLALPPASRAVLVLREYQGLAYQEIADTLHIPVGTVMSRLNYARQALRQSLAGYMGEA